MLHQAIIPAAAANRITPARDKLVLDSWTAKGKVRASTRGTKATRKQPNPLRLFARNIRALAKPDTLWLTRETKWLDGDRKYTVEAPQTHIDGCGLINKNTQYHEAEARHRPETHGRFNGSITLVKTGGRTLVATVRLAKGLRGAATVQLRTNSKPTRKTRRVSVRLLSYLGMEDEINLGLSVLAGFLAQRHYVEQAMRRASKGENNFHASYQPMRIEGRQHSTLDPYNSAGLPGSPERVFLAKRPDVCIKRSWAQRELTAG